MINLAGILVLLDKKKIAYEDPKVLEAFLSVGQVYALLNEKKPVQEEAVLHLYALLSRAILSPKNVHDYEMILLKITQLHEATVGTIRRNEPCWYILSRFSPVYRVAARYVYTKIQNIDGELRDDMAVVWKMALSDVANFASDEPGDTSLEVAKEILSDERYTFLKECISYNQSQKLSDVDRGYAAIRNRILQEIPHGSPDEIETKIYDTLLDMTTLNDPDRQILAIKILATLYPYRDGAVMESREATVQRLILETLEDSDNYFMVIACALIVQEQYTHRIGVHRIVKGTDRMYREDVLLNRTILKHLNKRPWWAKKLFIGDLDRDIIMSRELIAALVAHQDQNDICLDLLPVRNILCSPAMEEFLPVLEKALLAADYVEMDKILLLADPLSTASKKSFMNMLREVAVRLLTRSKGCDRANFEHILSYLYPSDMIADLEEEDLSFILAAWHANSVQCRAPEIASSLVQILLESPCPPEQLSTIELMGAESPREHEGLLDYLDFPSLFDVLLENRSESIYSWMRIFEETFRRGMCSTSQGARLRAVLSEHITRIPSIVSTRWEKIKHTRRQRDGDGDSYDDNFHDNEYNWRRSLAEPFKRLFVRVVFDPNEQLTAMLLNETLSYQEALVIGELMVS